MRTGKRLLFISFLAMAVVIISIQMAAAAPSYTVATTAGDRGYGPYQAGSGGEFTLVPNDDLNWVLGNYSSYARYTTQLGTAFQTFCLEKNEYIDPNTIYSATLSNAAIQGGIGGATANKDTISLGTARLYYEFAKGILPGYSYTTNATPTPSEVLARKTSADLLQKTIWWLEGEIADQPLNIFTSYILGTYITEAERIAAVNAARADNSQFTLFPVMALNISRNGIPYAQSQLVVTPIPAAIWLLGTGLVGLVVIRRRFTG